MAALTFKEKLYNYEELHNYKMMPRLPVIIHINGRSFNKVTSLLEKPYCDKFSNCLASSALQLCLEIEGAIIAYQYNDEIVIVVRNDQTNETIPWYDNKIQKIVSICASITTMHFNNLAMANDLNLNGDAVFIVNTYTVPSVIEAIQLLVAKQQYNSHIAIQNACNYELLKFYDKNVINQMLTGLSTEDKVNLLQKECNVNFNDYPPAFTKGIACYKSPKIVNNNIIKNKWTINSDLPIFAKDQTLLINLFKNGFDILRQDGI